MPIAPDIVAAVARRLADRAGLELPAWVIEARATARIAALDVLPADYVALIESTRGTGELDQLIEAVRVGETRLFRHRSQIAALADDIVPVLRARGKRAVRVWSAGCAAGEEPYTLAIVLARTLPSVQIQVIATDVSAEALAAAQSATYPSSALSDVPEPWRDAFLIEGESVRVRPELASLVRFERANLVEGTTPRGCDLVWCRNVLIYFTPEARRRVVERLVAATNPGGHVFVGYSESLREVAELDAIRAGDATYYVRRETARTPATGVPIASTDARTPASGTLVVHGIRRTPASGVPTAPILPATERTPPPLRIPPTPPAEDVLALRGHPDVRAVMAELSARLAIVGLRRLIVDLDGADLLADELAPVLRRARAAANAAHVELALRATRTGARRWLARHGLEAEA